MASENETREMNESIESIVADMRCDAKLCRDAWLKDPKENPQADCIGVFLDSYARRIEAAWKREREEFAHRETQSMVHKRICEPQTIGNAAALREALVRARGWLERMNKERLDAFAESQITPAYAVNRQAKTIIEDNEYHIGQINDALSAPPRNCDLYNEDAWQAYKQFCERTGGAVYFDMVHFWPFANWLFAAAEEGADA